MPDRAYAQPDHLDTPRVVIDPVRNVAIWEWSKKSEVFGNQIPSADPDGDGVAFELALRFPGQQATDVSGLFYNYQRERRMGATLPEPLRDLGIQVFHGLSVWLVLVRPRRQTALSLQRGGNVAAIEMVGGSLDGEFYLIDYKSVGKRRVAKINEDGVLVVSESASSSGAPLLRGVVGEGRYGARYVPMAFLSWHLDASHGTPDYSRSLVLMIDGKLMGDGFSAPVISWSKRCLSREFHVNLEDGWNFRVTYTVPLIREFFMQMNVGGTLDAQSVDFIEQIMMVVAELKPDWIVAVADQNIS